jgi:SAM-dependent methyltransferase
LGYFAKAAREAGHISVTYDPYAGGSDPESNWDAVVALHVLEHANNPDEEICRIKSALCTGGHLILAVPNFEAEGYRLRGMNWVWAQPPIIHIFHFTAAGVTQLLQRHGFSEISVSYHDRWDANRVADIESAAEFARADRMWSLPLLNRLGLYRRWIARRNADRRFSALRLSQDRRERSPADRAELEVFATLADGE